ncbi:hypothetical protein SG34_030990 [Thalassomonas viridans]|uniref:Glutathionylspermidine synthase pre-ATP-grasp-like domain-containing protein n=1 Tax=Thalassomonas viridans TaxID=137584 RepID=A0AAF0CDH5_9GAMM|nr:hypothetical protein [Thalassomonas viridans]WDE09193.1 hypothetical protein SG34_030990 [Thalassomonas viridans]
MSQQELPDIFGGRAVTISPWPVIINAGRKSQFEEIVANIGQLLYKSVALMAKHYPLIFKQLYQIPEAYLQYIRPGNELKTKLVGRYDALISNSGIKLLEYNGGCNIGGWWLYELIGLFREVLGPHAKDLKETPVLEEFLSYLEKISRTVNADDSKPVNILFELDGLAQKQEFVQAMPMFNKAIKKRGLNIRLFFDIDFTEVNVNGESVYFEDKLIDVLVAPMVHVDAGKPVVEQLTHLHFQEKVVFLDNPVNLLTGIKSNFANLYFLQQQGLLSLKESELVSKYISWTAYLSDSLTGHCGRDNQAAVAKYLQDKDSYVIKKDGLFGGRHVYIGRQVSASAWKSVVTMARKEQGWTIQKFYPSDPFYAPNNDLDIAEHDYILGFFDFGSRYGGCWVRLTEMRGGVVNATQGAACTVVFEVPQKKLVF